MISDLSLHKLPIAEQNVALGKNTKTFVIMGTPLGFAMHNIVLGTFGQWGMPSVNAGRHRFKCVFECGKFFHFVHYRGDAVI